jgi:hypothetical protein
MTLSISSLSYIPKVTYSPSDFPEPEKSKATTIKYGST